jgi:hypothetical protein
MSCGLTLPRPLRDFADRESAMQELLGVENSDSPNPENPKSDDTCPHRLWGPTQLRHLLRSCDRGSQDRDFTGHNSLASQNPEPRFSDATLILHTCAHGLSPMQLLHDRTIGPRDFGFLLDNSKSSILFLLKSSSASPPLSCMNSPGVCSHSDTKVFFQTRS